MLSTLFWILFSFIYFCCCSVYATNLQFPILEKFKPNHSVNVGNKFTLLCSLQEEISGPVHFEWFKNGHPLVINKRSSSFRMVTSEGESLFIIEKLVPSDSGNYSCTVKSQNFRTDSQFTVLTVKGLVFVYLFGFVNRSSCGAP